MNYDYIHQCGWILQTELIEVTVRTELGGREDNQWNWEDKAASVYSRIVCVPCFGDFIFLMVLVWFGENFFVLVSILILCYVNGLYISGGYYVLLLSVCTINREAKLGVRAPMYTAALVTEPRHGSNQGVHGRMNESRKYGVFMCMCINMHTIYIHTHIPTYIHTYAHTWNIIQP